MYGYIYLTTNLINGKRYIGQKKSNVFLHEKYLGSGFALKKAIEKYGKENFSVELIEQCKTEDELNIREKYWIDYYNAVLDKNFYNEKSGGRGFSSNEISKWQKGSKRNEHTKQLISESKVGKNNPMYGKHHKDSTKKLISEALKTSHWNYGNKYNRAYFQGHKHSEETKDKIRKSLTGQKRGKFINNGVNNKVVPDSEIDYYLSNGWKLGILRKSRSATTIESVDGKKNTIE